MLKNTIQLYNAPVFGFSNKTDESVMAMEKNSGAHHYRRLNVVVRQAKGSWITDVNGKKYLDCLAAYSAANLGHHHPRVVNAMVKALSGGYGSVISNVVYTDPLALFLSKVATFAPQLAPRFGSHGNKVLPKNGGVESVETAIKMARYYGWKSKGIADGKQEIIVFDRNFHGRMISVVSFSTVLKYKQGFGPLTPGFVSVPFGDVDAVEKAITPNTCGILVEPLQGEGGMVIPPKGFLKGLRELSDRHDLLLMVDEIQVGLGRTGKNFCFEHEGVVPDGLILGKALSGGLVPLSVFVTNAKLMDMAFQIGSDGSTFGGYPLACVAGIEALNVLQEERLAESAARQGKKLKARLLKMAEGSPHIKEVRGKGLFIGIEVNNGKAMAYCRQLLDLGLIINDSHGHTIRVSPPLNISDDEIDFLAAQMEKVMK
ncbi:RocD2: ornithine aminotransferase [Desulfosarcina variabilis str. Montpellier]|uniref:aspartate aminotransferase family protein n=1 Tax=Desulfosarcina variabilis TaxID=2300 RepID=UPI003AFA7301